MLFVVAIMFLFIFVHKQNLNVTSKIHQNALIQLQLQTIYPRSKTPNVLNVASARMIQAVSAICNSETKTDVHPIKYVCLY